MKPTFKSLADYQAISNTREDFEKLKALLDEKGISSSDIGNEGVDDQDIGKLYLIDLGLRGDGFTIADVFYSEKFNVFLQLTGWYGSNSGTEYDSDMNHVTPYEHTEVRFK
jgi:hypothetical protein